MRVGQTDTFATLPFKVTIAAGDTLVHINGIWDFGPKTAWMADGDELVVSGGTSTSLLMGDGHTVTFPSMSNVFAYDNGTAPNSNPPAWTDPYLTIGNGKIHVLGTAHAIRIRIKTNGGTLGLYGSDFTVSYNSENTIVTVTSANSPPVFYGSTNTTVPIDKLPHVFPDAGVLSAAKKQ